MTIIMIVHVIVVHTPIALGGIKIRSLLDTGSTISAINEQLFLKSKFANKSLKQPDISHIIAYKV
jgi:hypothetical protein